VIQLGRYQRMLECFALLSAGRGDARALAAEAAALREEIEADPVLRSHVGGGAEAWSIHAPPRHG